jgi:hypothetical protein
VQAAGGVLLHDELAGGRRSVSALPGALRAALGARLPARLRGAAEVALALVLLEPHGAMVVQVRDQLRCTERRSAEGAFGLARRLLHPQPETREARSR